MNRRSFHFAALAALAFCWPAHGQQRNAVNPPGNPKLACTGTFLDGGIDGMQPTWITNGKLTNGTTKWWQFLFYMWYEYECNLGSVPECGMCTQVQVTYLLPNGRWTIAPYGLITGPTNNSPSCNSTTTVDMSATWGYPLDVATPMRISLYVAPTGADCTNGNYKLVDQKAFNIPPPPF